MARVEHTQDEQRSSNNFEQIASLFSVLNTAWRKTSQNSVEEARKIDTDKLGQSNDTSLSTEVNGMYEKARVMSFSLLFI